MTTLPKSITVFSCYGCDRTSLAHDFDIDGNRVYCPRCGAAAGLGSIEIYRRDEQ